MEIADFVRARLDEDAEMARRAGNVQMWKGEPWTGPRVYLERPDGERAELGPADQMSRLQVEWLEHAGRHMPGRVLADVAAKRRIVDACCPRYAVFFRESDRLLASAFDSPTVPTVASSGPFWPFPQAEEMLRTLAATWAGHPDFQPEWLA